MPAKLKNFVSETDKFLKKFDNEHHELTENQQHEIDKNARIHQLRDEKNEGII